MNCGICQCPLRLNGRHYTKNGTCSGEMLPLKVRRSTAAYEALRAIRKFFPWRELGARPKSFL
jgi:hypothetical protein